MGLGITAPFGTARLREMALAHFEGTLVKATGKQFCLKRDITLPLLGNPSRKELMLKSLFRQTIDAHCRSPI